MSESEIIIQTVCEAVGVKFELVYSKRKFYELVIARSIIAKILHSKGYVLTFIGRLLNKHHTSIMHFLSIVDNDIEKNRIATSAWEQVKHLYNENGFKRDKQIDKRRQAAAAKRAEKAEAKKQKEFAKQNKTTCTADRMDIYTGSAYTIKIG